MELGRTKKWFYLLLGLAVAFIFFLGAWWLYLVFKLAKAVETLHDPQGAVPANLALMVKWEGLSFFFLVVALGAALFYVFWQDHKKTKSLQTFYATLTHELKTPLASMGLQAQVLGELIQELSIEQEQKDKITRYGRRLSEDVSRLENELDKHLHLSRLEGGGNLNLAPTALIPLIKSEAAKFPGLAVEIDCQSSNPAVLGDRTALSIIFKNLFENTLRHGKGADNQAAVSIVQENGTIKTLYDDGGQKFGGDPKKLGRLFYKHESPKGSGIGLYLAKRLAARQGGKLAVINHPRLMFELTLPQGDALD